MCEEEESSTQASLRLSRPSPGLLSPLRWTSNSRTRASGPASMARSRACWTGTWATSASCPSPRRTCPCTRRTVSGAVGEGLAGGGRRRVGEPPVASQARLLAGLAPRRRGSGGPYCDWVLRARGSRPTPPPGTFLGLCGALVLAHQNRAVFFGVGQSQFVLREVSLALFSWCGCCLCFCFDAPACQVLTVGAPPGALGVGHHPGLSAHLDLCAL